VRGVAGREVTTDQLNCADWSRAIRF